MSKMLTVLAVAFLLLSCSYRLQKKPDDTAGKLGTLGFSEITATVFGPKCSRCHGNEWVGNYTATHALLSKISERIQSTQDSFKMPPPGEPLLTDDERAAVLSWIARGGPLGSGEPPPPAEEPLQQNFSGVSRHVLIPRCLRCHDTDFDSFEHTRPLLAEMKFRVNAIGTDDQMPPETASQLTEEEKTFLLNWIDAGAPEN